MHTFLVIVPRTGKTELRAEDGQLLETYTAKQCRMMAAALIHAAETLDRETSGANRVF